MAILVSLSAADTVAEFAAANKYYEQGQYAEAISAYREIIESGRVSAALYFNLGNAYFKQGKTGWAIVHYLRARNLVPRDPDVNANLRFARDSVIGTIVAPGSRWQRWLGKLSLNEWTGVTVAMSWIWCFLLILVQAKPAWRGGLRTYLLAAGIGTVLAGATLALTWWDRSHLVRAIVVVPETVARHGPLPESLSHFTLNDGAEVRIIDQQNDWIQVRDSSQRMGWVPQNQVALFSEWTPHSSN